MYERLKKAARRIWNKAESVDREGLKSWSELFRVGASQEYGSDLSEVTYFTCLKVLSESMGKMPIYLIDGAKRRIVEHETVYVLRAEPNKYMTPSQMLTYLEYNRNHYGNGYIYIIRDRNGSLKELMPLDSRRVQVHVQRGADELTEAFFYCYTDRNGRSYYLDPSEVIHVKSWLLDETKLVGRSVREILASSLMGAKASTKFLNDLYQRGLTANAVVKYVGDLKKESQDALLERIEAQARSKGRRMITLPIGFELQPLDLKLTDNQFSELKKYSALQIAAAFGLKPNHLNDYSKSSYANSASQNLSFYVDTLLYIVTMYEQEIRRKLLTRKEIERGLKFKFNVSVLLRGDPTQQAEVIEKMIQSGVYSVDEARELLDYEPCTGGDAHLINGSYLRLEDVGAAYSGRGVERDAKDQKSDDKNC